jgi:RNA polymerase sigma-70 factor (ECF subfamily)
MDQTRSTLLLRVRNPSDAKAWGEFVALYQPLLTAYVRQRGLGEEDTRDVVQDVFARLVKSLPEFELARHRGRFRTWLWQVCRSALCDWARRRRRRSRAEDAWLKRLIDSPPSEGNDSDVEWVRLHRRRIVSFALEQVKARSQAVTWSCFEGHLLKRKPSAQIARELGVSVNAVNINSSRILDRIRRYCAEHLEDLADGQEPLPGKP